MKKNLLFVLLALPFVIISCVNPADKKHSVEIIVKDAKGAPFIGANVYITTEDISDISKFLRLHDDYHQQRSKKSYYEYLGYSEEKAEKTVKDFYEQYNKEYITDDKLNEYFKKYEEQKKNLNWEVKAVTNSLGTINCSLKEGDYTVLIFEKEILVPILPTELSTIGYLSVPGTDTKVFTLK